MSLLFQETFGTQQTIASCLVAQAGFVLGVGSARELVFVPELSLLKQIECNWISEGIGNEYAMSYEMLWV